MLIINMISKSNLRLSIMTIKETFTNRETLQPGPILRFVLPKLVLILIAHLLLNIKKKKKKLCKIKVTLFF